MRVWIARAEPAASRTAQRLLTLGHDPLVAPIFAIALTNAPPPDGRFDAVLLTSANAVPALARAGLLSTPVFAVGHRTAEAAHRAGAGDVTIADGNAIALAALVRSRLAPGAQLLHAAGADRKPEPGATLEAEGYRVAVWIAYVAKPVPALPLPVRDAFDECSDVPLQAVLHYSRRSAALTLARAESAGCGSAFAALRHLCLSSDVAVPLAEAGIAAHFVAVRPDEASLLAGLADPP